MDVPDSSEASTSDNKSRTGCDEEADLRLEYISGVVQKSLRLKSDKWQKMIQGEDKLIVFGFFNSPYEQVLVFFLNQAGFLQPHLGYSSGAKSKVVYFIRNRPEIITAENVRSMLVIGELSNDIVSELTVLAEEIITPLLCNAKNQKNWPDVVVHDVKKHVYMFKNALYQINGELNNKVILPMPALMDRLNPAIEEFHNSNGEIVDLYLKTDIEGVSIQWVTQIHKLLNQTSSSCFTKTPFPFPMDDIKYWSSRLENLEGIYAQLREPRVKKMALYLESTDSVYMEYFKSTLAALVAGIMEARDIVIHQKPLIPHFQKLENYSFMETKPLIRPMFHCIGLLWGNSQYYCNNEKISVLLKELCNLVIQRCIDSCDSSNLFFGEAAEQAVKIQDVIDIIELVFEVYHMNKAKIESFFTPPRNPVNWIFDFQDTFGRLLKFLERLKMVRSMLMTTIEMIKLEKVEYSGLRGKNMSMKTVKIYERYLQIYNKMSQIQYDPLNIEDDSFVKDCELFQTKVSDIDRRLAKIFGEAFDECTNLESIFKMLQILGDLANRPRIQKELCPRYNRILILLKEEFETVTRIFTDGITVYKLTKKTPMIDAYYPPVAGMLWWIYKIKHRIMKPFTEFEQLDEIIALTEESSILIEAYRELMKMLTDTENDIFTKWCSKVSTICKVHLKKTLLVRNGPLLELNFNDKLVCLLRETRYIMFLENFSLPQEATDLYSRNEPLYRDRQNLTCAISWYNNIRKGSHESEVTLIESEIIKIDELLKEALQNRNWTVDNESYTTTIYNILNGLQQRVLTAQNNVKTTFETIYKWSKTPLFDRITKIKSKKMQLLAINENDVRKKKRHEDIQKAYSAVTEMIKTNYSLFFNLNNYSEEGVSEDSKTPPRVNGACDQETSNASDQNCPIDWNSPQWLCYVEYIDSKVSALLLENTMLSMKVFMTSMDIERGPNVPFITVTVELQEPNIIFNPPLEEDKPNNLKTMIRLMISDIKEQARLFKRINYSNNLSDYSYDLLNDDSLKDVENNVTASLEITIEDVFIFMQVYEKYAHLWLEDRQEFLEIFLNYGKVLSRDKLEKIGFSEIEGESIDDRPNLSVFREQIDVFENLYTECEKLTEDHLFNGWLFLDLQKLRQALLNIICKWSNVLKENLADHVHENLNTLDQFIEHSVQDLSTELSEYDYNGLLRVMACLINVREKQIAISANNSLFQPLSDIIELLKSYSVDFPEESFDENGKKKLSVYTLLEVLPEKWNNLVKLANVVSHNVGPLQMAQTQIISKQVTRFNAQMQLYRNEFKLKKFFHIDCPDIYELIDKTHLELGHLEEASNQLEQQCQLFAIMPPDSKIITSTRKELKMIKQLWDYYFLVQWTIEDWKMTPWKKIDAEGMDMECKRFTKDLRMLDKEMRNWEPFIAIENVIKNLLTSLRAVTELQNPSIRDRHWIELMKTTKLLKVGRPENEKHFYTSIHNHQNHPHLHNGPEIHPPEKNESNREDFAVRFLKKSYSLNDFGIDIGELRKKFAKTANSAQSIQKSVEFPHLLCEHFN